MVLVYVHQYLDSSRKPNQNGSRICWTIGGNRKWRRAKIVQSYPERDTSQLFPVTTDGMRERLSKANSRLRVVI